MKIKPIHFLFLAGIGGIVYMLIMKKQLLRRDVERMLMANTMTVQEAQALIQQGRITGFTYNGVTYK